MYERDAQGVEPAAILDAAELEGLRVLEVGCGEGRMTWQYARETRTTIGIDLDTDALRIARADKPADLEHNVLFTASASEYLPFSKETFDIAILAWSL